MVAARKKKLLRRGWFWTAIAVVLIIAVVTFLFSYLVGFALEKILLSRGAIDPSLNNVQVNIFTGSVAIRELRIGQLEFDSLHVGEIDLRIRLRSLFSREINIKELIIRDAELTVDLTGSAQSILSGTGTAHQLSQPRADGSGSSAWSLSLVRARIEKSSLKFVFEENRISFEIDQAELLGLETRNPSGELTLSLQGNLNESPLDIEVVIQPGGVGTSIAGHVSCSGLMLEPISDTLQENLGVLTGFLDMDADIEILIGGDGGLQVSEQGSITLRSVSVKNEGFMLDAGMMRWDGEARASVVKEAPVEWAAEGEASAAHIRAGVVESDLQAGVSAMAWRGRASSGRSMGPTNPMVDGSLGISGLSLGVADFSFGAGNIVWEGEVRLSNAEERGDSAFKSLVQGGLTVSSAYLDRLTAVSPGAPLEQPDAFVPGASHFLQRTAERIIAIDNLSLPDIRANGIEDLLLSAASISDLQILQKSEPSTGGTPHPPLLRLEQVFLGETSLLDLERLEVRTLDVTAMSLKQGAGAGRIERTALRGVEVDLLSSIAVSRGQLREIGFTAPGNANNGQPRSSDSTGDGVSVVLDEVDFSNLTFVDMERLGLVGLELRSADMSIAQNRFYISSVQTRNLQVEGTDVILLPSLSLDSVAVVESPGITDELMRSRFPLSFSRALVFDTEIHDLKHIRIGSVQLNDGDVTMIRPEEGPLLVGGFESRGGGIRRVDGELLLPGGGTIRISRLGIMRDSVILYIDASVEPSVVLQTRVRQLQINDLNTEDTERTLDVYAAFDLGTYTDLGARGTIRPFLKPVELDLFIYVNEFELITLTPYLMKAVGYGFEQGRLSLHSNLSIDDSQLEGDSTITLRNLRLVEGEGDPEAGGSKTSSKSAERAINVLSDKKGTAVIEIPISGDLSDPKFNLEQVILTALGRGVEAAAKVTLGVVLWPFSGIYVLASEVSGGLSSVQLEPVYFKPGKSKLDKEMQDYLEQVAQLLEERPKVDLSLCSVATSLDRERISNDKRLRVLAQTRAEEIKEFLQEKTGIDQKRLFICLPRIDATIDEPGRVELQL
jgi:outer membrane protein OmpA-like peptidoglycan-associated protein